MRSPLAFLKLLRLLQRSQPDIVHMCMHHAHMNYEDWRIPRLAGIYKVICNICNHETLAH